MVQTVENPIDPLKNFQATSMFQEPLHISAMIYNVFMFSVLTIGKESAKN